MATNSIPRTFHRIWLGGNMPAEFEAYGETWRLHHPGWRHVLWTEQNLPKLVNQREFDQARTLAQKADIARYEILYDEGGVYIDCDFECYRPIDDLLENVHCFSSTEDETWISIGILGAIPQHPLLRAIIEEIPRSIVAQPNAPVNTQTGPLLFTRVVAGRRMRLERDDLVVFPPRVFYPYRFGQPRPAREQVPDAYAAHHWAASWMRARETTTAAAAPVSSPTPQPVAPASSSDASSPGTPAARDLAAFASKPALETATPAAAAQSGQPDPPAVERVRVMAALDPDRPDPVFVLLVAFGRLFRAGEPVELGLYAYSEPSLPLLHCVQELLSLVLGDLRKTAGLSLLSKAEIADLHYDVAFAPSGDAVEDARGLYDAVYALQRVRDSLDACASGGASTPLPIPMPRDELLRRIAKRPSAAQGSPAESSAPSLQRSGGAGIRGAYIGEDRVLIHASYGRPIVASAKDRSLTPELLVAGCYDTPLLRFLSMRLAPGDVAFDIGANIGFFTVLMGQLVGAEGRVLAYEASPGPFALLVENITLNQMNDRVAAIPRAAWSENKHLVFHASERFWGNGSIRAKDDAYRKMFPVDRVRSIEVDAEPLDQHASTFARVQVVRIDVEGAEYQVLRGMDRMLRAKSVRSVIFECARSRLGADWEPFLLLLKSMEQELRMGFSTIGDDGKLRPLELGTLAARGDFMRVVMEAKTS